MKIEKNQAQANGRDIGISTKQSIEICNFIKKKETSKAKSLLEGVIKLKTAVPYNRFKRDIPHRKGMASGRYPSKAAQEFLRLVNLAESNAKEKGLDSEKLFIRYAIANKGASSRHAGRFRGLKRKRTHISIILEEKQKRSEKKAEKPKGT